MRQITNEDFASSTIANEKVVIKLGAEWCGPCHVIQSVLDEIDKENEDITIFNVDVDEEIELVEELGIRSVPTTLFYKNGDLIDRKSGTLSKKQILEVFNN